MRAAILGLHLESSKVDLPGGTIGGKFTAVIISTIVIIAITVSIILLLQQAIRIKGSENYF